jgi:hypothetical protein
MPKRSLRPPPWTDTGEARWARRELPSFVVGLSAKRAAKKTQNRDDMNRAAHNAGVSIRQLAEVTGLGRKIVAAVVSDTPSES